MSRWPLKVGFDGRALISPAGGVRRYAVELLRALGRLEEPLELMLLGGPRDVAADLGLGHVAEPWHPPTNAGWSVVGLPRAARVAGVQVIHAPAYTGPFWSHAPVVLTIHDVSYERHPEWFPYKRDAIRRAYYRRCAVSAAAVLTDSQFSADEIRAAYGLSRDRITVAPLGVAAAELTAGDTAPLPPGVRVPFLLHVGDVHARRNLGLVADALRRARDRGTAPATLSLVLAGVDREPDVTLGDAVRLGAVDEPTLRSLYRHATALVYPSLYEGFGLPLLEAMACGLPVMASRAASIPEVTGDAAVLLDPQDGGAWADAISRAATDAAWRAEFGEKGRARAAAATWARTATITAAVYRQVAGA
ncbi:MAG: glycosyltransferase family 4 protein [Vicinamibacterales bacterium]